MRVTRRLADIAPSPTMAVMQKAEELRARGVEVVDLGPGEPDFPTPAPVKEAGMAAIRENFTRYTSAAGILELRQAVADQFRRHSGKDFSAAHVVISCGAKHAIFDLCMALFEEGDEVLLPVPYWVTFPEVVKMTGATAREILTQEAKGFVLQAEQVEESLGERTRGLIVNTPNNPTGALVPARVTERLVALSRERGMFLLFDETYDAFTYEGEHHASLAAFVEPDEEGYAVVGSLSKTYSMTGWRIGYCVSHPELIRKIVAFQSHQTSNPSSISQKAALAALQSGADLVLEMKQEYARRRRFVIEALGEIPGFACAPPLGAFYVFPNVGECMRTLGIGTSEEFCTFLIEEAGVATVPGSAFGLEGHIRLSYATSMENLREAFARIKSALSRRTGKAGVR